MSNPVRGRLSLDRPAHKGFAGEWTPLAEPAFVGRGHWVEVGVADATMGSPRSSEENSRGTV